jgi:uncharacterized phage protein (TIGR02220 family)
MAKNFPFFKFLPTEWLTGNIAFEDLAVQGLFINVCSIYWQRDGILLIEDIKRRYKREDLIERLTVGGFIEVENEHISISFLDEQLEAADHISKRNSENGKKGAYLKALKTKEKQATPLVSLESGLAKSSKEEEEEEVNKNKNISKVETFEFDKLLDYIKKAFNRDFRLINKAVQKSFNARLKEGYSKKDIMNCIDNLSKQKHHIENGFQYCTPEFVSRALTLEKYSSKSNGVQTALIPSTSAAPHLNL